MTATDVVEWCVFARAVVGSVFVVISLRMMVMAFEDRAVLRSRGVNGMTSVIVNGTVFESVVFFVIFLLLAGSAWLVLPLLSAHAPYGHQQAIGSVFVFVVLFLIALIKYRNWRGYNRLVQMAMDLEATKRTTPPEAGR